MKREAIDNHKQSNETNIMQTFKTNDVALVNAAQQIKQGNAILVLVKKQVDASKTAIEAWLKENRQVDIAALPIGEMVNIDGVCLIEVGKQSRLDQAALQLEQPEVFAKYRKEFPCLKFKPLV